jgi:hypothetical protein
MKDKITYDIVEEIAVLSVRGSWALELNRVAWNGGKPKYDIRSWDGDHTRMGKGVTLNDDEMNALLGVMAARD